MKKENDFNYVGIDIGKTIIDVVRLVSDEEIYRNKFKTSKINSLLNWLRPNDIVALEAGNQSFRIAKTIINKLGLEVIVLNPGDLATIYNSLKKTDKEDALKLARLIKRIPKNELPTVSIPTDEEENGRRLTNEQSYWSNEGSSLKNRLHSIFTQAGLTEISKKDISNKENREKAISQLPDRYKNEANRLHKHIIEVEETLSSIEEEINSYLKNNSEKASILLSMPGIGSITCLSILSYLGNINRFSKAKQVSYYVGLVPRVDISGSIVKYGHIVKRGCKAIKRLIIQCAWVLVNSKQGGALKDFYDNKKLIIGKKKAIVAVSRKMIEIIYIMLKNGETYKDADPNKFSNKLKRIGII